MAPEALTRLLPSSADSARVIVEAYTVSLIALVPLGLAGVAVLVLSRRAAAVHAAIWRCAIAATVVLCVARLLPHRLIIWMLPDGLAAPIVSLERAAITGADQQAAGVVTDAAIWPQLLVALYLSGVLVTTLRALAGIRFARSIVASARPADRHLWDRALQRARRACGVTQEVRLVESDRTRTPFACGGVRPVIVMPIDARHWTHEERAAALMHEMAHHKRRDVLFAELSVWLGVLLWFHPAVWVMTRRAGYWAEMAADDVVLGRGIKRSVFAALLVRISNLGTSGNPPRPATSFVHGTLRARLQRIVHALDAGAAPSRTDPAFRVVAVAMLGALPLGAVQLAPTKTVLASLMLDGRWDTRAYAVTRLAQRPDSIDVARQAASHDPSPRVRAWAARAVALQPIIEPRTN
jgi:beta-lactamase regulating signal transducer with metallopeptidase domain